MENNKLKWCFRLRDGSKIVEPNERLAKSYLEESKSSLERADKNFRDNDLLWTTVEFIMQNIMHYTPSFKELE